MADNSMTASIHRTAATPATVQRRSAPAGAKAAPPSSAVAQLRHALAGRAEVVQMKALGSVLQRRHNGAEVAQRQSEEEEPVQAKAEPAAARANGLPSTLQAGIESMSGVDMSDVQVHRNSSRPAGLAALAYAQGRDIHLAPGQERHLPHEAWHVVQQRQGRVQPTMQLQGVPVNDDSGLEAEADRMGQQALSTPRQEPA